MNQLCDRLWLIAAIEHYTAVLGDFSLNCAWDDHDADPTIVDLFRWHGSEEVEHRMVAHDVAHLLPRQLRRSHPRHDDGRGA